VKATDGNENGEGEGDDGEPHPGAASASPAVCILLLEDHPGSAAVTRRLLASEGYLTHCAATCEAAREVWEREHCTVLVADLSLPDGSSLPLMRELRARGVCGVMLTGHDEPEHRRASREAGFATHLVKPVSFAQLLRAVLQAARGLPVVTGVGTDPSLPR
jgi:DNA-binding response OmpR family regulator